MKILLYDILLPIRTSKTVPATILPIYPVPKYDSVGSEYFLHISGIRLQSLLE